MRSAKRAIAGSGSKFGRLSDPQGVAVDQDGNVIVSDSRNHRLQVYISVFVSQHATSVLASGIKYLWILRRVRLRVRDFLNTK